MNRLNFAGAAILGIAMGIAGAAHAVEPLTLKGPYRFETNARQDGRPVCSETWTFGADGVLTVASGQEVVSERFRTEHDRDGHWIVTEVLATNGKPDCTGKTSGPVKPGERRSYVVPLNGGDILTCPPPGHTADGVPVIGNCYGRIFAAPPG